MARGYSGGPRLGRQVAPGAGVAGPLRNVNYRQQIGKRGSFQYRWNGGTVLDMINRATFAGMNQVAINAEIEWNQIVHVITGHLKESAHFIVDVGRNGKMTVIITNDAEYADFEERGTIHREGHFPVRQTVDRVVRSIPTIMASAYRQAGFNA